MRIERKIFYSIFIVFFLGLLLTGGMYLRRIQNFIQNSESEKTKLLNNYLYQDINNMLTSHKNLVETLNVDGDVSSAYDNIPWLAFMGKKYIHNRFDSIFKTYPYLKRAILYKFSEEIIVVENDSYPSNDDPFIQTSYKLSFEGASIKLSSDIVHFIQNHLIRNQIDENYIIKYTNNNGSWLISSSQSEFLKHKSKQDNNMLIIDNRYYIASPPNENDDFSIQALLPHDLYREIIRQVLARTIFIILLFSLLIYYITKKISHQITRPLKKLENASKSIIDGDYSTIEHLDEDETKPAIEAFNSMSIQIKGFTARLQEKIKERTKELEEKNIELNRLATIDTLTSLSNRARLSKIMELEMQRAERYNRDLCLIMLDIDHFKKVNDTHGHLVGDKVLIEFAKLLSNHVRNTETPGRWGGEEFLIICPETDLQGATVLANSLCQKIASHKFPVVMHKTASIGVSIYKKGDLEKDITARADEALYKAKKNGRNRVEVY